MNFLSNQTFQFFIGLIITLIIAILPFYKKYHKAISYEVITDSNLLIKQDNLTEKIKVIYNNKVLDQLKLIEIIICNCGKQPILKNEYISPIFIELDNNANILSAAIIETKPKNITCELDIKFNVLSIIPNLLNPKDSIKIKLLVNQYESKVSVNARVINLPKIVNINEKKFSKIKFKIYLALSGLVIACILSIIVIFIKIPLLSTIQTYLMVLGIGYIIKVIEFDKDSLRVLKIHSKN